MVNKLVQTSLVTLGFASVISLAPTFFGSMNANAQINNTPITEEEALTNDPVPLIGRGIAGPPVEDVQRTLVDQGYYDGPIDGIYGPETEAAVRDFQSDEELIADGIVGENTWDALNQYE